VAAAHVHRLMDPYGPASTASAAAAATAAHP
jgi:hypothetical protein